MRIIAFDAATKTGWAIVEDGSVSESGVQDFTKRRGESPGFMFMRFRKWLRDLVVLLPDDDNDILLVYEQAHHRGGAATEICVNLTGRIQEFASEHRIEYAAIHTASLKKWATGSGRADKAAMMARAAECIGRPCIDDNESDAVLLGLFAWEQYGER